jgi:hypothetical protein
VAPVQPAGSRGGLEQEPSSPGAAALPVDLRQQPRRILHGPRRRADRPGARERRHEEPGRADAGRAAGEDLGGGFPARPRSAEALDRAARRPSPRRHRPRRARRSHAPRARVARRVLPRPCLPDPDAARRRPCAPVPVHPEPRFHHCPAARPHQRRARPQCPYSHAEQGGAVHPPARLRRDGRDALHSARKRRRDVHRQALPRLHGEGAGVLPPDPRQRPRGRGGGRGPRPPLRVRAQAAAARRGDSAGGRRRNAGRHPPVRRRGARCPGGRDLPGRGHARAQRGLAARRARASRPQIHPLPAPLPRAHPRAWHGRVRRNPPEGHRRPPPLRIIRRGRGVPSPGGPRPERRGDQADALPHVLQLSDHQGAGRGCGGGQVRHRSWSSSRPDSTRRRTSGGRATSSRPAFRWCSVSSS